MHKKEFFVVLLVGIFASYSAYQYQTSRDTDREREKQTEPAITKTGPKPSPVGKPPLFSSISGGYARKKAFFDYLRPGIARENHRVGAERVELVEIQRRLMESLLSPSDTQVAQQLGKRYRVKLPSSGISEQWIVDMLHRVDVIPEGLVLVQGANESAWGTSRFAREANNYFGQWCYKKGCGVVPLQRGEGMTHEVAKFSSPQGSIHGYFMNVNRNSAYEALREIRFQRHQSGLSISDTDAALALTDGLIQYSERGEDYVNDLKNMIRHNREFWQSSSDKK
jgi:Bax protein